MRYFLLIGKKSHMVVLIVDRVKIRENLSSECKEMKCKEKLCACMQSRAMFTVQLLTLHSHFLPISFFLEQSFILLHKSSRNEISV